MEVLAELVLLYRGTIRRIFERKIEVKKRDPFRFIPPYAQMRCLHSWTEEVELSEGVQTTVHRCANFVDLTSPNGYLCYQHQQELLSKKSEVKSTVDADTIANIIETEKKALSGVGREVVGSGRIRIQFVEGLRMSKDPDTDFLKGSTLPATL